MAYGPLAVYSVTMASAGTTTGSLDLQRSWKQMWLEVPTMTSNTELYINASSDSSTFRYTYHPMTNSGSPTGNRFLINSAVTGAMVPIPNGLRYLKVESRVAINNGAVFKIICSD